MEFRRITSVKLTTVHDHFAYLYRFKCRYSKNTYFIIIVTILNVSAHVVILDKDTTNNKKEHITDKTQAKIITVRRTNVRVYSETI